MDYASTDTGSATDAGPAGALYPFLTDARVDVDAVFEQVRHSTEAKAREIRELRVEVHRRDGDNLLRCASAMAERFEAGGRLLAFGNGGSSTDAQEIASQFLHPDAGGTALPALGLTSDIAVVTALCNDVGFDVIFARQLGAFGGPDDIAVGISTSGNSANLLAGFAEAKSRGMLTVGIAGYEGGKMSESDSIDHLFVVPSPSVHRIQEAQTTLYHALWELTQNALSHRSGSAAQQGTPVPMRE
ncbi:SIS domain-containing protein [Actinopolyspora erythraea]|uniref:SIS domain-containing protein n=1 Tax=Actinopolyspora erythraea TaxID=414996 RepID=A0A223RZ19_9ACTN|nr:SIS domain-containing protein [Actinopolyspora erythraea]